MNPDRFKEHLLVFGADVNKWPEDIRGAGLKALEDSPECRSLMLDEERFEKFLRSRKHEEPSGDLADRIILASQRKKEKALSGIVGFFSELLSEFNLPRQAVAAVAVLLIVSLIIGLAIGFSNPGGYLSAEQYQANLQDFLYYQGEVL
jgi:hypothetical protein